MGLVRLWDWLAGIILTKEIDTIIEDLFYAVYLGRLVVVLCKGLSVFTFIRDR